MKVKILLVGNALLSLVNLYAQYSIDRFSVSGSHGRPRKNNHSFGIYEIINLRLINYTLLA